MFHLASRAVLALVVVALPATDQPPPGPPVLGPSRESAPPTTPGEPKERTPALIRVTVPPTAQIWIEDQKTLQGGTTRVFQTPALTPGRIFYYTLKVSWPNGPGQKDFIVEQEIMVKAGQTSIIDFTPLVGLRPTPPTVTPASYVVPKIIRPDTNKPSP